MKSLVLPLLFITLFCNHLSAKKNNYEYIDSALTQLPRLKEDTNKVNLLGSLSTHYFYINSDSGLAYGMLELALAEKLHWKKGLAIANNNVGISYYAKSNYDAALRY